MVSLFAEVLHPGMSPPPWPVVFGVSSDAADAGPPSCKWKLAFRLGASLGAAFDARGTPPMFPHLLCAPPYSRGRGEQQRLSDECAGHLFGWWESKEATALGESRVSPAILSTSVPGAGLRTMG